MKDTTISNCESEFVVSAIKNKKRLDGRLFDELRSIELHFGSDFGCAYVTLGETKVLAQASCELCEPRNTRKNEGNIFVNVEINDMVCGVFETGHHGHLGVHTNRLIEKCIKDSRCVDLEALCIISEEQAWEIRVDVTVLNYDGNLFTCCSLAALAALAHFKTPHVALENGGVRIESIKEHEPEPLSLNHYPILVAFAIFGEAETVLLDPTELEEKVCDSELIIGMNSFRELCGMHFSGRTTGNRQLIVKASQQAALVALDLVKLLKTKLEEEAAERKKNRGKTAGLVSAIHLDRVLSASQDRDSLRITRREIEESATVALQESKIATSGVDSDEEKLPSGDEGSEEEDEKVVHSRDKKRGVQLPPIQKEAFNKRWVPSGNKNAWALPNATLSDEDVSEEEDDVDFVGVITDEDRIVDRIELDSDEEADTVEVGPEDTNKIKTEETNAAQGSDEDANAAVLGCRTEETKFQRPNDSSSYSITSPSYSSDSSLGGSSSADRARSDKPNYNPPSWDWSQPSSSKVHPPLKVPRKRYRSYSPSSPSSSDSGEKSHRKTTYRALRKSIRRRSSTIMRRTIKKEKFSSSSDSESGDPNVTEVKMEPMLKQEPSGQILGGQSGDVLNSRELVPYSSSNSSPAYSLPVMEPWEVVSSKYRIPSPAYTPSSPPSLLLGGFRRSPVYSPSSPSPQNSPKFPSSPTPPKNERKEMERSSSRSGTKRQSCSPDYSPSYSATSCQYSSPMYSPSTPRKRSKSISHSPLKVLSPTYTPSSPSKAMSVAYTPSSPSVSKPGTSPAYSPSSPSFQPSPTKAAPSPSYTPSSPSKQPPSPPCSPNFIPGSPESASSLSQSSLEYSSRSPDSSLLYSPTSSRSPDYSSSSSESKIIKKRVKLQRSSPTSPGSMVSELLDASPEVKFSKMLKVFSPSASPSDHSQECLDPSPKYSPSSRKVSSVSETGLPPYSPSSPSHPPPSPSISPSSPPSTDWSSGQFSLPRVKPSTSEPATPVKELSLGSPHYSLDSLSSYSSSSFSSGLPSPSSGSPRYSPSPSEASTKAPMTPSPPLSPSITLTSPRVSSSGSSTPCDQTEPSDLVTPDKGTPALPSLSVFSPSVSPELPDFSPSSPSHHPPSPSYSPSSPSYSSGSGSCSPPGSTSTSKSLNTSQSSLSSASPPNSPASISSASTEAKTLVLKVLIPKHP